MVIESGSRVSGSKGVEAFEVHGLCWRWQHWKEGWSRKENENPETQ